MSLTALISLCRFLNVENHAADVFSPPDSHGFRSLCLKDYIQVSIALLVGQLIGTDHVWQRQQHRRFSLTGRPRREEACRTVRSQVFSR